MSKFSKLIPGYATDLDPKGVYIIGKHTYDFKTITEKQCIEVINTGSKHIKKVKSKAVKSDS